jgi:O-antigen ligase
VNAIGIGAVMTVIFALYQYVLLLAGGGIAYRLGHVWIDSMNYFVLQSAFCVLFWMWRLIEERGKVWLYAVPVIILVIGMILMGSRTGMLSTLVGFLLFLVLSPKIYRLIPFMILLLLVLVTGLRLTESFPLISEAGRRYSVERIMNEDESAAERAALRKLAWEVFLERPLLGIGWRQFVRRSEAVGLTGITPAGEILGLGPHNLYLTVLSELGMLGGVPFFAWLAALWWGIVRQRRKALSTAYLAMYMVFGMAGGYLLAPFYGFFLGAGMALDKAASQRQLAIRARPSAPMPAEAR